MELYLLFIIEIRYELRKYKLWLIVVKECANFPQIYIELSLDVA